MMSTSFLGFFDRSGLVAGGPATVASGLSNLVITGLIPTLILSASITGLGQLVLTGKAPTITVTFPNTYFLISGFVGSSSSDQSGWYDRTNTGGPWYSNYQALATNQYLYHHSNTSNSDPGWTTDWLTVPDFDLGGTYFVVCSSTSSLDDTAKFDITFMNGATEIASIWFTTSGFQTRMSMGTVLYTESVGSSNFFTGGNITFTSSSIVFTNTSGTNGTGNLTLSSVSMDTCTSVRVRSTGIVCNPATGTNWAGLQLQKTA